MAERKLPSIYYNWVSVAGAYIASVTLLLILFFLGISLLFDFASNPYLGIIQFLVLPTIMIGGLIFVPVGGFIFRRRIQEREGEPPGLPHIDFNKKSHRNGAAIFAFGSVIVIFISVVAGYQTFHYSESVSFCGLTCHEVMKPEYVAYQNSPHARVACASCHIGTGAGWWAKSKLSGAYQVYAVLANDYPKPIPTPIKNLRPAQETCEQCHWPQKFFGAQQRRYNHFMYDEGNTPWPIDILIRTGGGDVKTGQERGIHWHMNIGYEVEYIARDDQRQDIPWVRSVDRKTQRVTIYQDIDNPLTEDELATLERRQMDCMDCHNRPSHIYNSPDNAVDLALLTERIDHTLPYIKMVAVEAMDAEYETEQEAKQAIATKIADYYELEYPELYDTSKAIIDQAIAAVQEEFGKNIFPEMKVRWTEYPTNLGHFMSEGCMRCHDGSLIGDKGQEMTTDCTTCHVILAQGSGDRAQMASSSEGLEFVHPEDIDEAWREMGCYECHSGVQP